MEYSKMCSAFRMVCNDPEGDGVEIEHMPECIDRGRAMNEQAHTHTYYEIIWFREAGGVHTVDFQDYEVKKNMLIFLAPGQVHHFDKHTHPSGYSIKMCTELCDKMADKNDALRHMIFFAFPNLPYAILDEEGAVIMEQLIHQIEREEATNDRYAHHEMLSLFVRMLMIVVIRNSSRPKVEATKVNMSANHQLYVRFRSMLEEEFDHMHLVQEYADKLGVSTKTLTLAVRTSTGRTPLQLIDERLVLEAKRLLRFSDLMVKEIAYHIGFDDPSNFVKFFRRHTGYLPGEYQGS